MSTTSQGVEITIATDDDVMLDGVSIETQNEVNPFKNDSKSNLYKTRRRRVVKERTLLFDSMIDAGISSNRGYALYEGIQ